jgi:excisionase family DNA binding protein
MENLYKPREAAAILGVSYETVLDWIGQRTLPAMRLPSGHYRIDEYDLDAVLVPVGKTSPRFRQVKPAKQTEKPPEQPAISLKRFVRSRGKAKKFCKPFGEQAGRIVPKTNQKVGE